MARTQLPKLPQLLERKVYKTGQTRGADDDDIFQNRVSRNSTVLLPFSHWESASTPPNGEGSFENGLIALVTPGEYFEGKGGDKELHAVGLHLGINALVLYETRAEWMRLPVPSNWTPANQRPNAGNLGGQFIARIPATTAATQGAQIRHGYTSTDMKGAGIRIFEYASTSTNLKCRLQLEGLFWRCADASSVVESSGMRSEDAHSRMSSCIATCETEGLWDIQLLQKKRLLNADGRTTCPLCLRPLSAAGFFNRLAQAEGRAVHDLTVTEVNLFHIDELRLGAFNHRPYNLGWGCHHCNVVVRDVGIVNTLEWMDVVLDRNRAAGLFPAK